MFQFHIFLYNNIIFILFHKKNNNNDSSTKKIQNNYFIFRKFSIFFSLKKPSTVWIYIIYVNITLKYLSI